MDLDQSDFEKIIEFLSLENFFIDKNFNPKPIGDGQSNPTFLIRDTENNFKVLRTQPIGDLARGAHRVDREYFVLKALSSKSFEKTYMQLKALGITNIKISGINCAIPESINLLITQIFYTKY